MSNKLFIGNLSWNIDDAELKNIFAEYGEVEDAKVITDRETGRSRGFGFVTYTSAEEAQEAIKNLDGQEIDGRDIAVNVAKPQER